MAPKKSTKEVVAAAPVATPAPAPVAAPVKEVQSDVPTTTEEVDKFAALVESLQKFQNEIKDVIAVVKGLQKEHAKLVKSSSKKTKKSAEGGAKRQPSGFAKPTLLSDQLCDFLGVAKGSSLARTEVTRIINEYIKKNSLQDSADKRKIVPDAKLKGILKIEEGVVLSYFNLQSSLKHHFTKA